MTSARKWSNLGHYTGLYCFGSRVDHFPTRHCAPNLGLSLAARDAHSKLLQSDWLTPISCFVFVLPIGLALKEAPHCAIPLIRGPPNYRVFLRATVFYEEAIPHIQYSTVVYMILFGSCKPLFLLELPVRYGVRTTVVL